MSAHARRHPSTGSGNNCRSFENGYYDYRLKPYDGGYAQDKTYSDKTKLQEYDFETDKLLFVPGDWNTQRPQLYYYEGTVWYRKHLNTPCSRASAFS